MYKILKNELWALIPARGGSKSIPLKNMADLNNFPLLSYTLGAAVKTNVISRIWCSTDHPQIKNYCGKFNISIINRPEGLSGDNVSTTDVITHAYNLFIQSGEIPEFLVLLEPTSPFIKSNDIEKSFEKIKKNADADSVQTIIEPPPNHHALNQRVISNGLVEFRFYEERKNLFNKQLKPKFYVHGNCRIMRSESFLKNHDIYGKKSLGVIVSKLDAMDVDGPDDFALAEIVINSGLVSPVPIEEIKNEI